MSHFTPSVTAPLEEWDNTTDAIIWLIENTPDYQLTYSELVLEQNPEKRYGRCSFEPLESQSAELTGWPTHGRKVKYTLTAETCYVKAPDAFGDGEVGELEGYKITVEMPNPVTLKKEPYKTYLIVGSDRSDFRLAEASEIMVEA
jgi:hypothetical protein